jgi:hypothetical protein
MPGSLPPRTIGQRGASHGARIPGKDPLERRRAKRLHPRRLGEPAASQALAPSLAVCFTAFSDSRFANAAAWPRARFATEFAPLSHMLINGFFFVHGFGMTLTSSSIGLRNKRLTVGEPAHHVADAFSTCHVAARPAPPLRRR